MFFVICNPLIALRVSLSFTLTRSPKSRTSTCDVISIRIDMSVPDYLLVHRNDLHKLSSRRTTLVLNQGLTRLQVRSRFWMKSGILVMMMIA